MAAFNLKRSQFFVLPHHVTKAREENNWLDFAQPPSKSLSVIEEPVVDPRESFVTELEEKNQELQTLHLQLAEKDSRIQELVTQWEEHQGEVAKVQTLTEISDQQKIQLEDKNDEIARLRAVIQESYLLMPNRDSKLKVQQGCLEALSKYILHLEKKVQKGGRIKGGLKNRIEELQSLIQQTLKGFHQLAGFLPVTEELGKNPAEDLAYLLQTYPEFIKQVTEMLQRVSLPVKSQDFTLTELGNNISLLVEKVVEVMKNDTVAEPSVVPATPVAGLDTLVQSIHQLFTIIGCQLPSTDLSYEELAKEVEGVQGRFEDKNKALSEELDDHHHQVAKVLTELRRLAGEIGLSDSEIKFIFSDVDYKKDSATRMNLSEFLLSSFCRFQSRLLSHMSKNFSRSKV